MFERLLRVAVAAVAVALVRAYLLPRHTSALTPPSAPTMSAAGQATRAPPRDDAKSLVDQRAGYGRVELAPDHFGQYHAEVEIDGRRLPMLVDTGASFVALTYADAAAVGVRPMPSDFNIRMSTANGMAAAAAVRLREVHLDTIVVDDVPAIVMPQGAAATSLLGMSFLKKLRSFEIAEGNLVLKP